MIKAPFSKLYRLKFNKPYNIQRFIEGVNALYTKPDIRFKRLVRGVEYFFISNGEGMGKMIFAEKDSAQTRIFGKDLSTIMGIQEAIEENLSGFGSEVKLVEADL